MIARALGMTYFADASHQLGESRDVVARQNPFLRAQSENNLGCTEKRSHLMCEPRAREL